GNCTNYALFTGSSVNATDDFNADAAYRLIARPGAEDPPAWSSWSAGIGGAITIALKPKNDPPTLTVTQPDGAGDTVTVGDLYNITYNLSDPDNVVTAAMYYDTDAVGLNGTAITGACASAAEGTGATCSWNTTGVTPGSYYVYGITSDGVNPAVNDYSPGQITINAALPGAPGTPTFSNVGETSLRVNWTAAGGAVSYKIERCQGSGCVNFSQIASGVTTLYYDDSSLSANTIYRYQIRATNAGGDGPYSGIGATLTFPAAPGTPTFSNVGEISLRVDWTAPAGGAASYKVERCQGSGCVNFSQIASGVTTLYYDDSSLSPNTTYRYQIRATNSSGDGAYSGIGSVTTSATPVITVGAGGSQTSSLVIPSSNNYVGGAFTFSRSAGSTDVTQITLTETGSVDANANLSNVKIYYETTDTCSYGGSETLFGTGSFNASSKSAITGTMSVGASQVCAYAVLDVGSGAADGQTLEIEISNPSTEVLASAGNVAPSSAVAISGTTTLNTIPVITVGAAGNQISPFIIPSTNNYVGGAFTFSRSAGSTDITQITVTETGSVNAQTNLSNVKLYYETADTCSYGGGESQFGATASFNGSAKATFTGSITVGAAQVCAYAVLNVGSGAADGQTLEIEISNPSTEVLASAGNVAPSSAVAISGTTTLLMKPEITSVSPDNGKLSGGTNVTITGAGFLSGASVTFGGSAAANIIVVSNTTITADTPAHSAGAVDVVVINTNGQSGTLTGGYAYNPSPTVTGVNPPSGPIGGNTDVTITGAGFLSGASVTFGGSAATSISVVSSISITAKTPAHSAGAVDVIVQNTDTQLGTLVNGFSYTAGPVITSVSPDNGKLAGGTNVTITGGNFQNGAAITFDGVPATNVVFVSGTTITATTPAHAAGAVNVTVTNPDTQSHTLTGGYTYNPFPTVISVSPSSGSTGGDNVTVAGAGFLSGASVTFGGLAASNIIVVSSVSITALTPARAVGTVDVIVQNADTQSGTLVNGFSYVGPPVSNLTANPASIYSGELSVLNWTSTDASACTASGAWSGSKATTGNEIVSPTSTSTYTLTCDGPGGSTQVSVIITVSGEAPPAVTVGGVSGTQFYFGGFAYANGTVFIYDNGAPAARLITGDDGSFSTIIRVYVTVKHIYSVIAYDKEKQSSPAKTFPSDIYSSRTAGGILMAPTINLSKRKISKKEEINVYGYATPEKKVKIEIDGKMEKELVSGETGYYNANISAAKFSEGSHKIRAKQIDEANKESDYSILKLFTISELLVANTDLNGDNILNITDWSIFLSSWASKKTEIRAKIDLNGDGKINISDLSVFLSAFSKKKK
ncbi:MAG: IPT/TIG domain-containing protein, partial [Patescibacteria group bacterium]